MKAIEDCPILLGLIEDAPRRASDHEFEWMLARTLGVTSRPEIQEVITRAGGMKAEKARFYALVMTDTDRVERVRAEARASIERERAEVRALLGPGWDDD